MFQYFLFNDGRHIRDKHAGHDRFVQSSPRVRFLAFAEAPAQLTLDDVGVKYEVEFDVSL